MSQWIPVGERLPEDDRTVLIRGDLGNVNTGFYLHHSKEWGRQACFPLGEITHWMPLPAPPA